MKGLLSQQHYLAIATLSVHAAPNPNLLSPLPSWERARVRVNLLTPRTQNLTLPPCYNTHQASPFSADSPYSAFEAIQKDVTERPERRT